MEPINEIEGVATELIAQQVNAPPPATKTLATKKKKKVPRRKMDVAEVVVHYSGERAEDLKVKLKEKEQHLLAVKEQVKKDQQVMRSLETVKDNLQEKFDGLTQVSRAELVEKYRKIVTQLKLHPMVSKFAVDRQKRIVITTKPVFIKLDAWETAKEAGMYQIRIDFSESNVSDGIHVLNITRRFGEYDSPTIKNTRPCWGGVFREDIDKDFATQDLYELVVDMIDYISSPHDGSGWTKWEYFFEKAENLPKGYSFFKFDQEIRIKRHDDLTVEPNGFVAVAGEQRLRLNQLMNDADLLRSTVAADLGGPATATTQIYHTDYGTWGASGMAGGGQTGAGGAGGEYNARIRAMERSMNQSRVSDEDYRILNALQQLGFRETAQYYLMRLIREDESRIMREIQGALRRIEVRIHGGGQIELFCEFGPYRELNPMLSETDGPATYDEVDRRVIERYYANSRDLEERGQRELETHGAQIFILPRTSWFTSTREQIINRERIASEVHARIQEQEFNHNDFVRAAMNEAAQTISERIPASEPQAVRPPERPDEIRFSNARSLTNDALRRAIRGEMNLEVDPDEIARREILAEERTLPRLDDETLVY